MNGSLRVYSLQSGEQSGIYNMALDEALLESLRVQAQADSPVLIVRTYRWEEPTLSLGVNQQVRDIQFLLNFYGQHHAPGQAEPVRAVVRRPTGGRAILHGEDLSYAFITNDPAVLKLSLKTSYSIYADVVRTALQQLALAVQAAGNAGERDYLRSPVCFETHTPSDLLGKDGQKLSGSAQLRRAGGLLQHGAAFLSPYGVEEHAFSQALFSATAQAFQQPLEVYPAEALALLRDNLSALQANYAKLSGEMWAKVSTIKGSHLAPDSF
jgi:lipoate-protein ligase A